MSYQVLARKWRPKNFEDVVGQEHITRSLQNSLSEKTVGHAYIFSGTRGIGKTSVARIFAKALRCENRTEANNPCGVCPSCVDFDTASSMNVIEIDGASNNSVDNIRDLISNIQYLPSSGEHKIYIIDEVHMLSTSAFNALLKTLEEPPSHAIFILATTEPEKLLGTVLSRCQRFDFRNATIDDLVKHLKRICEVEGIEFSSDILFSKLAKLGNGSFRDTLSLLDQLLSFSLDKKVTDDTFSVALGIAKTEVVKEIIESIANSDIEALSRSYRGALSQNVSLQNIVLSLLEASFGLIMAKDVRNYQRVEAYITSESFDALSRPELYWIYEVLSQDLKWALESLLPEDACEIVLRKIALRHQLIGEASTQKTQKKSDEPLTTQIPEPVTGSSEKPEPKKLNIDSSSKAENKSHDLSNLHQVLDSSDGSDSAKEQTQQISEPVGKMKDKPSIVEQNINEAGELEKAEAMQASKESHENSKDSNIPKVKDWEAFLAHLFEQSPASASNLEQGNLLEPIQLGETSLTVQLGFPGGARVFFDYLNEPEAFEKLKKNISNYFEIEEEKIHLNLQLVEKEKAIEENFKSKAEIKAEQEQRERDNQKEKIATDPLIKHAESIFNTKIDRIQLNDKN